MPTSLFSFLFSNGVTPIQGSLSRPARTVCSRRWHLSSCMLGTPMHAWYPPCRAARFPVRTGRLNILKFILGPVQLAPGVRVRHEDHVHPARQRRRQGHGWRGHRRLGHQEIVCAPGIPVQILDRRLVLPGLPLTASPPTSSTPIPADRMSSVGGRAGPATAT